MGGDYTRLTFDPVKRFTGVRMQQGRVQLDSDWNELVDIIERRARVQTMDTFGPCAVPQETPDAFRMSVSDGSMSIGPGRMYVDGLLAENNGSAGSAVLGVDPFLGELRATEPLDYASQPFLPDPPALPQGGAGIAYLKVWQREITAMEDPTLVEPALGTDTATRLQTAWQVRVAAITDQYLAAGDVEGSPEWQALIRPPEGRLSTSAVGSLDGGPPAYTGGDNRLYRVEIHDSGSAGSATFKWSSANASVVSSVTAINQDQTQITLALSHHDRVLGFKSGDWVEVIDDRLELAGQTGAMALVRSVDPTFGILNLETKLPAGLFDAGQVERHTRVRRWDQKGTIHDSRGRVYVDLANTGGVIPIPTDSSLELVLEHGIAVCFSGGTPVSGAAESRPRMRVVDREEIVEVFPGGIEVFEVDVVETSPRRRQTSTRRRHQVAEGHDYHTADFWTIAARANGWLEILRTAPPRGIYRHYCPLAIVNFPDSAIDLRIMWPPKELLDQGPTGCGCTACVTASSHNAGNFTVQQAIDQVKGTGGTVCLGPGVYRIEQPIDLSGAESVRLAGAGWSTLLVYAGTEAAIRIDEGVGITIEDLSIVSAATTADTDPGEAILTLVVRGLAGNANQVLNNLERVANQFTGRAAACAVIRNSAGINLRRCLAIQLADPAAEAPVIGLEGLAIRVEITDNILIGASGVTNTQVVGHDSGSHLIAAAKAARSAAANEVPYLVTAGLAIEDNQVWCSRAGISLGGLSLHLFKTRIADNRVSGGQEGGILLRGATPVSQHPQAHRLTVEDNLVRAAGPGILVGVDYARVRGNEVTPAATLQLEQRAPVNEAIPPAARDAAFVDAAIGVTRGLRLDQTEGCEITGNRVVGVAGHGVVVDGPVVSLLVEANEVTGVGGMGIEMALSAKADTLTVRANRLSDVIKVARDATIPASAIRLHDVVAVHVIDNTIDGVGQTPLGTAGRDGIQLRQCQRIRVRGNDLRRFGLDGRPLPDSAGINIDITDATTEIDVCANVVRLGTAPLSPSWRALWISTPSPQVIEQQVRQTTLSVFGPRLLELIRQGVTRQAVARDPNVQPGQRASVEGSVSLPGSPMVSVRGNLLEAAGTAASVEIGVAGCCRFADNQCLRSDVRSIAPAVVTLHAGAAIFSGNFVLGQATMSAEVNTTSNGQPNAAWTALGNVCQQALTVNGSPLTATAPLNFTQ